MKENKGYKIDIRDYIIPGSEDTVRMDEKNRPILDDAGEEQKGVLLNVKQSIIQVFVSAPRDGRAALLANKLVKFIEGFGGDFIILETVEYQSIKVAFENFPQFRPMIDGELISRVLEPEYVNIKTS